MKPKPDVSGIFSSRPIKAVSPNQTAKGTAALQKQAEDVRAASIHKPTRRGSR